MMSNFPNMSQQINNAFDGAFGALTSGVSFAQLQEIDPQKIEAFYALGHRFYMRKDYKKAEEVFAYAYFFDHLNLPIVKGLASARKMQGKFKEALHAYALAVLLDMEDPTISFHAGECFFALGDYKSCAQSLDAARDLAENRNGFDEMIKKIDQMKTMMPSQNGDKNGDKNNE